MSNSINTNRPDDNYYLDYFLTMLSTVEKRYQDLFTPEDRSFLARINRCSPMVLRLLIRLYMRKGPNFIADKLDYAEVEDTATALSELAEQSLIQFNPEVYAWELIDLLPVAQSRSLFIEGTEKIKKADMLELWLEDETLLTPADWGYDETIITPCDYDCLRRFQLLYFGNERQTLTDFILENLGVAQYEKYPLDSQNRFFQCTEDIDTYLELSNLSSEFYLINEAKNWSLLNDFAEQCLSLTVSDALKYRWHKLLNRVAYRLEQLNELNLSLTLFQTNSLPPSRERQVRILHKLEKYQEALAIMEQLQSEPKSESELTFYQRFINKLNKPLSRPLEKFPKPIWNERYLEVYKQDTKVEEIAASTLGHCHWLENTLPMSIFGLAIWSAVFADVPGVWHHPFQSKPTDLYEETFYAKRDHCFQSIFAQNKSQLRGSLVSMWQEKQGISNPFVHWKHLTLELVLSCFDALSLEQWHGVFKHILTDIKHHRSGFPDLFQRTLHEYEFIEIKGPGDKLQDNQVAWLKVFNDLNINASVCYVSYL
ncbi:VRR-NUC domain-containing protein [Reinekea marina]|uniref:phosphodiesterase I n=1 Tax=Reinekea marina TaxID=1310421 RepID=A0ABV7WP68_9GAMM|nr:VRR-NUC domain-containing protein [Reinekea marina]MDN3650663.1 VRR-NUC domain-containing protein [Reinekea marina]